MKKQKALLVATGQRSTWPVQKVPFVFLGAWCKEFDHKNRHAFSKHFEWPYHWNDREKAQQDCIKIEKLYQENISYLGDYLNKQNNVNHTTRFWKIVAGPWFRRFLMVAFDRWEILTRCWQSKGISEVSLENCPPTPMLAKTTHEFVMQTVSDEWNNEFFGQLCSYLKIPKRIVKKNVIQKNAHSSAKINFREWVKILKEKFISMLSANDKYCFCETFLSSRDETMLNILCNQIPKKLKFNLKIKENAQINSRINIVLCKKTKSDFKIFLSCILPRYIPKAFLEDFAEYVKLALTFGPKNPNIIFTSNSHVYNELFKYYAAHKIEKGSKLIIAQHGGFYGLGSWGSEEKHEIEICDSYLTWGWKNKNKKVIPFGILSYYKNKKTASKSNKLLFIQNATHKYTFYNASFPMSTSQWQVYFNEQKRFLKTLPAAVLQKTYIRLIPKFQPHNEQAVWKKALPNIKFESSPHSFSRFMHKYTLAVVSYQGTPFNELLYNNFPVVAFWNSKIWEIRKSAEPFIQELKDAGVLHETPESASQFIQKNWDFITEWWGKPCVQKARHTFCKQYAKDNKKLIKKLQQIFKKCL